MVTTQTQIYPTKVQTLDDALSVVAHYHIVDYTHFEGNHKHRLSQRDLFIAGEVFAPHYDYPLLESVGHIESAAATIRQALTVIADNIEVLGWDKAELYLASLIFNLKRAQLIIAAAKMNAAAQNSSEYNHARAEFDGLNSQLYGDINEARFLSIVRTEYERVRDFVPKNNLAKAIQEDLLEVLSFAKEHHNEEMAVPKELVKQYRAKVLAMYGNILQIVPKDGLFDAHQCAGLMNAALEEGGLAMYGWRAVVDSSKTSPSTYGRSKRIYLPSDTVRTSEQLRGLILHEQEVHARRFQNGSHFSQFPLLKTGTAEYLPVEEGLGTFMALLAAPKETSPLKRARERYLHVGLALGVDGNQRDARQVYEITWRILAVSHSADGTIDDNAVHAAQLEAYAHIENIFRGTKFSDPGIIYAKAKVYYEGLLKTTHHLQKIQGDNAAFVRMFLGKYNHTDASESQHIMHIIKPA